MFPKFKTSDQSSHRVSPAQDNDYTQISKCLSSKRLCSDYRIAELGESEPKMQSHTALVMTTGYRSCVGAEQGENPASFFLFVRSL